MKFLHKFDGKIEKGMFICHSTILIYFEVESVFENSVYCASRDPKNKTEQVFLDSIYKCVDTPPSGSHYVKLDREKNFFDKFHPEGWQDYEIKLLNIEDIKVGDLVATDKGCVVAKKKINNKKWITEGKQKSISKDRYFVIFQKEGKIGEAYKRP